MQEQSREKRANCVVLFERRSNDLCRGCINVIRSSYASPLPVVLLKTVTPTFYMPTTSDAINRQTPLDSNQRAQSS